MSDKLFYLLGCASGQAGADKHSGDGPFIMQHSPYLQALRSSGIDYQWKDLIRPQANAAGQRIDELVAQTCTLLAQAVSTLVKENHPFCVIGGDHSCGIGTWSGVYDAMQDKGDIGLIWIDAHMDSHTPETTPSGRIHGMPLACLLGYGYPTLTSILHHAPKIKPEHVCLIGVRSYESGEAELLKRLKVRIYFMDEVRQRGFKTVLQEAADTVRKNTAAYGLTFDLDSMDPEEVPGVDVPEGNGIQVDELCEGLSSLASDPALIASEVVEFDPSRDKEHRTEKLIARFVSIMAKGKFKGN